MILSQSLTLLQIIKVGGNLPEFFTSQKANSSLSSGKLEALQEDKKFLRELDY